MSAPINKNENSAEPFPAKQLLVLGICRLAEPIAFISIVSYNFALVSDIKGPENASFWAGVLVSSFAVAEASTAMIWGTLSDRFGRKPIILIGLLGTMISSLMLGYAKNYWIALAARVVGGLLNGNVAVMQTMVAEMVKNPAHEPRAYSIQPFAWSLGSIAGSSLGGYAAQPARFYPQYFSPDGMFGKYPYLLPNLVASICMLAAIIQAALFLEETNPPRQEYNSLPETEVNYSGEDIVDERTPLQPGRRQSISEAFANRTRRPSFSAGSTPTPNEPSFDVRRSSFASIQSFKPFSDIKNVECVAEEEDEDLQSNASSSAPEKAFTKPVIMWIVAIALMCYHQMAFVSIFPIYILDAPYVDHGLDLHGGLGLTVHDVGRYMAVNSFLSLLIQAFILPFFLGTVGIWKSIIMLTIFAPCVDIAIPFISGLPNPGLAVYPAFVLMAFCNIVIYPGMLIMLKNATPSKQALGKVNGLAVTASSAARTVGPPLIGIFYTAFGSAGAWWSCAVFGLFPVVELAFIPRPRRDNSEMMRKASIQVKTDEP